MFVAPFGCVMLIFEMLVYMSTPRLSKISHALPKNATNILKGIIGIFASMPKNATNILKGMIGIFASLVKNHTKSEKVLICLLEINFNKIS